MQGINQHIGINLGFSVFPKDTSTSRQEEPGFEPPTYGSLDDLLYLLNHSHFPLAKSCMHCRFLLGLLLLPLLLSTSLICIMKMLFVGFSSCLHVEVSLGKTLNPQIAHDVGAGCALHGVFRNRCMIESRALLTSTNNDGIYSIYGRFLKFGFFQDNHILS